MVVAPVNTGIKSAVPLPVIVPGGSFPGAVDLPPACGLSMNDDAGLPPMVSASSAFKA